MTDPRLKPDPTRVTMDTVARIITPWTDLNRRPEGPRDRQLIYGDEITELGREGGWSYVQAAKDGYCGYVKTDQIGPPNAVTHSVSAPSTHAYKAPDIKSPEVCSLTFGSQIRALSETATFIATELGFIPRQHLHRMGSFASDPIKVAELFLGTPYLWGGNTRAGIDCSGLVQAALLACDIPCPGDSDQQENQLGTALPLGTPYMRGDLLFWKGHVALVCDPDTIIHANAGHMMVVHENIRDAITRIETQGDGPVTSHRRL